MPAPKFLCVLLLFVTVFHPVFSYGNSFITYPGDTTFKGLNEDETILYNMINDMRVQNKLPVIPLSDNLSMVAYIHLNDIIESKLQENGCGLHSWSASGRWTPCCYTKDPSGIKCMKQKPKELTGYPGNGYELIYSGDDKATPADAAELWQQVNASADMILSRGKWKSFQWKAIGIGIKGNYALLWFGDKTDSKSEKNVKASDPKPVNSPPAPKQDVTSSGNYFLIAASAKTPESAQKELKRIKSKGYPNAEILPSEKVYRISIGSFDTEAKAKAKQDELKVKFPGIWVYRK